jgi:hypothetical protein
MYGISLLITTIVYPALTFYYIPKMNKKYAAIFFSIFVVVGSVFAYYSTELGCTFKNNIIDFLIINLFFLSIFGLINLILYYSKIKRIIKILIITLVSITVFDFYNSGFGPSEACGQSFPEFTQYLNTAYKVTHAGYQYGFMDYGSRFIIYKTTDEMENVIGVAEEPNYYYNKILQLKLNLNSNILAVKFINYDSEIELDTIYIQKLK